MWFRYSTLGSLEYNYVKTAVLLILQGVQTCCICTDTDSSHLQRFNLWLMNLNMMLKQDTFKRDYIWNVKLQSFWGTGIVPPHSVWWCWVDAVHIAPSQSQESNPHSSCTAMYRVRMANELGGVNAFFALKVFSTFSELIGGVALYLLRSICGPWV